MNGNDNPTVSTGSNATFPFDWNAAAVLRTLPDGFVPSDAVMREFLSPPTLPGDWFCNRAWQDTSRLLENDEAISAPELQEVIAAFSGIRDSLAEWANQRPDMSKGYGDQLPESMRSA